MVLGLLLARPSLAARYTAQFVDGNRLSDAEIKDWHDPKANTQLGGRSLFAESAPVRWVIQEGVPLGLPEGGYVEFVGGDTLPCNVLRFDDGRRPYTDGPPHLLVLPRVAVRGPKHATTVRVLPEWIQRIVWQRQGTRRYDPGHAFLTDGRRIAFQSTRFTNDGLQLLRDTEVVDVAYRELLELHLPRPDPWARHFRLLSILTPNGVGRLVQVETTDGLRATASGERFLPTGSGDPRNWRHVVQPAWSLDPLWIEYRQIRAWRFFAAHEVPLSWIEPVSTAQQSLAEGGWPTQRDRNVFRQPLQGGGRLFGWGFGIHARSELRFPLPALARAVRLSVGLDTVVGGGGCARARVLLAAGGDPAKAPSGTPLWEGPLMIGASQVHDTGPLPISVQGPHAPWLVLEVDEAAADRPAGADPLDIRDHVNWFEPLVELDPALVAAEMARQPVDRLQAWDGWSVQGGDARVWTATTRYAAEDPEGARFVVDREPRSPFLKLSRTITVGPGGEWLILSATRPFAAAPAPALQILFNGQQVARYEPPPQEGRRSPPPLELPLAAYRGQKLRVEVVHLPAGPASPIQWQALKVARRSPELLPLFLDEPEFVKGLSDGQNARFDEAEAFEGRGSLVVAAAGRPPAARGLRALIHPEPRLGEYRYLQFAWKKTSGAGIALELHAQRPLTGPGQERDVTHVVRYVAGPVPVEGAGVIRIDPKAAPDDWVVVTRDLAADLGPATLVGLRFDPVDGDSASFDSIQLGRTERSFANLARLALDATGYDAILASAAPGFRTNGCGSQGMGVAYEHRGKQHVLRTYPAGAETPCHLDRELQLPEGSTARLKTSVSADLRGGSRWKLRVRAGEETLAEHEIGPDTGPDGWLDLDLDLGRFAGQKILLRLEHAAGEGKYPFAYWTPLLIGP